MGGVNRFEIATDTGQFTPDQLQPSTVVELGFQGWAQWLREFLVPFPELVHSERIGVVVVGLSIRYLHPYRFSDSDSMTVITRVGDKGGGRLLTLDTSIASVPGEVVAAQTLLRVVALGQDESLAAAPGRLPGQLQKSGGLAKGSGRIERPVRVIEAELSAEVPIAAGEHDFVVHRHMCEVADQWSIVHVPSIASAARERLLLASTDAASANVLGRPLSRIDLELSRPLFLFDEGVVETSVYRDGSVFVHRIVSGIDRVLHAIVVEVLAADPRAGAPRD
jgi:acyl-CoA thioesterase FadM